MTQTHILIPKHEKLSDKEAAQILEKYPISQLPKILLADPALATLGAQPGDVIKITRESPTAGTSFYYRVVI